MANVKQTFYNAWDFDGGNVGLVTRKQQAEERLQEALDNTINSTKEADKYVQNGTVISDDAENKTFIKLEIKNGETIMVDATALAQEATVGEELLSKIESEIERAIAAEDVNAKAIESEQTRAEGVESAINTNLENEVTRAKEAESAINTNLENEVLRAGTAEVDLQSQIDAITATQNLLDMVGTKAELDSYETSFLADGDKIEVLADETKDNATTIYKWELPENEAGSWFLVGELGPFVTKSGVETLVNAESEARVNAISALETSLTAKASQTDLDEANDKISANTDAIATKAEQSDLDEANELIAANTVAIETKASQADLDMANGLIVANTTAIASKAEQSALDAANGLISANAVAIATKAEQSDLNVANNKITAIETSIATKASQDDLDTANGLIAANANAIATKAEQEDLINEASVRESADNQIQKNVDANVASIAVLDAAISRIAALENQIESLKAKAEGTNVVDEVSETKTLTGDAVILKGATVSNDTRVTINSADVTINDTTWEGSFPKSTSNAMFIVTNAEDVVIKNCTVNPETSYNGVEIGLSGSVLPKNVLIENVNFCGKFSNNAILVFGTQDNAVINVNNCHFANVSNALRLSNRTKASGVVVNFTNCTIDKWEEGYDGEYSGAFLFQDYTSTSADEAQSVNRFGDGKITINVTNLIHAGEKVTKENAIIGKKDLNQLAYVYVDKEGTIAYEGNENRYPIFNIN